jgi:acyl carrier protein
MSLDEIIDLIVDLLAQDAGRDSQELRRELEELGETLPVDSLLAAEVLTRVESAVGVSLPATTETARALRSVQTFAVAVRDLVLEAGAVRSASA